jgi:hypothetical protein
MKRPVKLRHGNRHFKYMFGCWLLNVHSASLGLAIRKRYYLILSATGQTGTSKMSELLFNAC